MRKSWFSMITREWYRLIAKSKVTDRYTTVDKLLNPLNFYFSYKYNRNKNNECIYKVWHRSWHTVVVINGSFDYFVKCIHICIYLITQQILWFLSLSYRHSHFNTHSNFFNGGPCSDVLWCHFSTLRTAIVQKWAALQNREKFEGVTGW